MPMLLKGSCRCGAVSFTVESHTPAPYQLCYCSICRKQQGGGYAINLGAVFDTLRIEGQSRIGVFRAEIEDEEHPGSAKTSTGERSFCKSCGTALWLYDPTWPDLVHPFASAIDTDLPQPPRRTHLMLKYKANWVEPEIGEKDLVFGLYPGESIADWHRRNGMWVD